MGAVRAAVAFGILAVWPLVGLAQRPKELADSDLVVAGLPFHADTAAVRAHLGEPTSRKEARWTYRGLVIYFDQQGRLHQAHLTSPRYATARGLRVGEPVDRVTPLYGATCYEHSFTFCRRITSDFDERGIIVEVHRGHVTRIVIGAVFET